MLDHERLRNLNSILRLMGTCLSCHWSHLSISLRGLNLYLEEKMRDLFLKWLVRLREQSCKTNLDKGLRNAAEGQATSNKGVQNVIPGI